MGLINWFLGISKGAEPLKDPINMGVNMGTHQEQDYLHTQKKRFPIKLNLNNWVRAELPAIGLAHSVGLIAQILTF